MIDERIQHRADVIKALAHPSRLAMVEALERGERVSVTCVILSVLMYQLFQSTLT